MNALLISGYHSLSQAGWADFITKYVNQYNWQQISLPPRYFSWRMFGGALSAEAIAPDTLQQSYDLLLATSSVDLNRLLGIYPHLHQCRKILYFHDNQFAYPETARSQDHAAWQMASIYSALSADRLLFNSLYNQDTFLNGVTDLLKKMPDLVPGGITDELRAKSSVLAVPVASPAESESTALSAPAEKTSTAAAGEPTTVRSETGFSAENPLIILWNHRWEWDKNPSGLLAVLDECQRRNLPIKFIISGQSFRQVPAEIDQIKRLHQQQLVHIGYIDSLPDYARHMEIADIVLSTAIHEFQGVAVMEAIMAGCVPLLPDDLSYPEFVPPEYLYTRSNLATSLGKMRPVNSTEQAAVSDQNAICGQLQRWLTTGLPKPPDLSRFSPENMVEAYNRYLSCPTQPGKISV